MENFRKHDYFRKRIKVLKNIQEIPESREKN